MSRLTDQAGNGVADRWLRFVGHLTNATCRVMTDYRGLAHPWGCPGPGGSLFDEEGYDVFFDGDATYAPAQPVAVEAKTVEIRS